MPPFAEPPAADLTGRQVVVANGTRDPMARPEQTRRLVDELAARGADVELLTHDGGHELDPRHLPRMQDLLRRLAG